MRLLAICMFLCFQNVLSQVLQPPYFDIARGKKMTATSTCGEGIGSDGKELFCKLAQASGRIGIKGQYCDYCYPGNHSIKYANDGTERWWQSPSLSRGLQHEDVNITLDLGQVYHVAYIIIKAANSPRPGVWSLMRSKDGGRTFTPWYNFASTPSECLTYHKMSHLLPLTRDDTVQCKMEYSQVPPFEDGEIHISLVNGRPGASNFSFSPALQEWTTASHIRLHFMKVKTLLGDLMPLSLQDPTVTRRYYYSIKEISVGGRCLCNGFADRCIQVDGDPTNYRCDCQHNACGARCDQCCPGYVQKKWRPRYGNDNFVCERCNCHGHSNKCAYEEEVARRKLSTDINGKKEGGGVCDDCQDNTYGINCEKCRPYYYRPAGVPITSRDACKPCNCSFQTSTGQCADGDGQCNCKSNYAGKKCDRCNVGYFNYPLCEACICDREGSVKGSCAPDNAGNCQCKPGYTGKFCSRCAVGYYGYPSCQPCNCLIQYGALNNECDSNSGQCDCKPGYGGRACDQCLTGYFNFPLCKRCDCDPVKTSAEICAAGSGVCKCRNNYSGLKCDQCADGFYGYPACRPCQCSSTGSSSAPCDKNTGKCTCLQNFRGAKCDQCVSGYYGYPACLACKCDNIGSYGGSCRSSDGQCSCRSQYQGRQCNKCQPGFYGFPNCQKCKCNPAGTKSEKNGIDCSSTSNGLCPCKDNVQGKECTVCKDGSFNLQKSNPDGCTNCQCSKAGSMSGLKVCSKLTGQCTCKRHVSERRCMTCKDGFYGLKELNLFGCKGCECDVGGSVDGNCSKTDGQCKCRDNVTGRKCNEPKPGFYAPTLHQMSAEIEDGRTPDGNVVRFDVQESKFPGYSGKGYSMMNEMQPTIIATVNVFKKSNYQIMFKYVLNQLTSVTAQVNVYPSGKRQGLFSGEVGFPTTQTAGSFTSRYSRITKAGDPTFFPLAPGKWDIEISAAPSKLLLDKVILIPEEYVDGKQLNQKVTDPCEVKKDQKICNQFSYLNMKQQPDFITVEAELNQGQRRPVVLFNDTKVLSELDFTGMAQMGRGNNQLDLDINMPKSGKYVFVVQYYHDSPTTNVMDLYLRTYRNTQRGRVFLNGCKYKFGCRQVAVNEKTGTVMVYNVNATDRKLVTLLSRYPTTIGIDSVTAIPLEQWNIDYVTPEPLCTTENNKCTITTFSFPKKSIRVDGASKIGEPVPPNVIDPKSMTYVPSGSIRSLPSKKLPAGRYYIVMHYYQPKHSGFDAQVSVDNVRAYPGVVKFNYCPHTFGCRVVVKNGGGSNVYTLADVETALRLSVPEGKDVWVDYVLFIPESVYSPMVVMRDPTSRVSEFAKECSKDDFYIKPTIKGFCRDGTFSLTTAFNNGTLACGCDKQGAADQNCEELGGQCRCRSPYITGRTCNRCRMGYFGFPNCQACKTCSNCDEVTGECKCPPGVYGDKCDKCKPGTYGYDQVVGCRPCKCDKTGTKNGDQKCDVATGQCMCNDNFGGRQCSTCRAGFFGFPVCKKCFCNEAGVTEKKCDANSGSCLCKPSVTGPQCDQCVAGNFKTEAKKAANLCLKCWCSGRSKKCSEATRYRKALSKSVQNQPWNMTQHSGKVDYAKRVATIQLLNKTQHVYWVSPKEYLNEGVLAYGGYLEFSIQFRTLPGYEKFTLTDESVPLVVIKGLNSMLHHNRKLQMQDGIKVNVRVPLYESAWVKEDGKPVSRIEFLETITMPQALHVRANHISADKFESTISPVQMSSSGDVGIDRAYGIENCQCPKEYTGTSCEKCAKGYTRYVDGTCVKCNCNGKATDCDPETGVCTGCAGNTMGDKCEKCKPGFYGDKCKPCECPMSSASNNFATSCFLGKGGTMTCRCKPGYTGLRCEKCADGYFGDPLKKGGSCKPCECNGNIDKNLTGNCDPKSGKCFKCLKNTDGDKCENCRIGYYGDAVNAKNCTSCKCDNCGSAKVKCDQKTGQCSCKKNVMGKRCTQCKSNTWNFKACLGCEDCNCGAASMSKQCDTNTGQCKCRPGVMGRKCDWCKLGFFNYTKDGCKKCNCPSGGYCDVFTGNCDCGAAGEKCRLCQPGHIITKNGCVKCDNCVQRLLQRVSFVDLNYSKQLNYSLGISKAKSLALVNQTLQGLGKKGDKWSADLETMRKALGYGNYSEFPGSLEYHEVMEFVSCTFLHIKPTGMGAMKGQMATSKKMAQSTTAAPATTMMISTIMMKKETTTNMTQIPGGLMVKPTTAQLSVVNRRKRSLEKQKLIGMRILRRLFRRAVIQDPAVKNRTCPASMARVFYETSVNKTLMLVKRLAKRAKMVADNSSATEKRAKDVLANVKGYVKSIEEAVLFANQTLMRLMLGSNDTNVSVSEIQRIRNDLNTRNFTETLLKSGMEKNMARNASMFADDLLNKTMMLFKLVKGQDDTILKIIKTFLAIDSGAKDALFAAGNGTELVRIAKLIDFQSYVEVARRMIEMYNGTTMHAMNNATAAKMAFGDAAKAFKQFGDNSTTLNNLIVLLRNRVSNLGDHNRNNSKKVSESGNHAKDLENQATILESLIKDTKNFSDAAVRAATVYSNIVEGILEALKAAQEANITALSANLMAQEAKKQAEAGLQKSNILKTETASLKKDVEGLKKPYDELGMHLAELRALKELVKKKLAAVKDKFPQFEAAKDTGKRADATRVKAQVAASKAKEALDLATTVKVKIVEANKTLTVLKDGIMNVNKLINEANASVDLAESIVPNYTKSLNDVKSQHKKIEDFIKSNITYTLQSIRYKISHARSLVNLAPIAAKFGPNTTVSLDSPFVEGESTNTVDMNIKTKAKDGLLMYSGGSPSQSRRRRQASGQSALPISYISLELKDGFVVFTAGVGSEMLSVKSPNSVANDKWHKIKAIRSFDRLKLEVERINGTAAKQVVSAQNPALYNLKLSKSSAVLLGGIPSGYNMPSSVTRKTYVGAIDHVLIDGNVRGIWNWKAQQNIDGAIQQKLENTLPSLQFFGDGFMKYEFEDAYNKFRKVKFSFRTLQKDALLLYGVDNDYPQIFASFELKNGALVYRYNNGLGTGEQVVSSEGKIPALNDGRRHNVAKGKGSLKIDGKSVETYDKSSQDISASLAFVGGVPFGTNMRSSNITKTAFNGCFISEKASQIIGVSGQRYIDVTKQLFILDFKNYKHGCSDYVAKAVSFDSPTSYLAINATSCSLSAGKSLGFSFQTYKLQTVLFYGQGKGNAVLSLIINDDGAISMSVKSGPNNAILVTDKKNLNDGKWHLVKVEQTDKRMKLTVDGQDKILSINQNIALSGKLYLGGLPPTLTIDVIKTYSLDGNMKNIFCDGNVIDLGLGSLERKQVTLAERQLAPLIPPTTQPPTTAAPATRGTLPIFPPDPLQKSTPKSPITFSDSTATTKEVDTVITKDTQTTTKETVMMTTKLSMTTKEAMTTKEIAMTTTAAQPTTTKAAPPTTTQPPPPTTTKARVTTTQPPPPTTTQAPSTTQPPPPTTTEAPVTTTQPPPPTTTQPPPPTTTKPPPPTTTQPPPPTTTQPPPPTTTQPPPPTTTRAPPPTTTQAPTMAPTTMAPTPPKIVQCALSGMPSGQGFGFGLAAQSYKPFSFKHGGYMYKSSKFSFSLSTFSPNGILIISSKKNDVYDYEIVYLEGGKVKYIFNAGSGSGEITATKIINDGKWHTITTTRNSKDGTLTVDGVTVSGRSPGTATALNSILKVYVGGAPSNLNTLGKMPKDTRVSIQGCIRDLKFKDKTFTSYKKEDAVGVTGCFPSYSKGLFVGSNGGYGTVKGNKIGKKRTIGLTVRSRSKDGLLYYIGRLKYDYVVIELVKGEIVVNVQNGAGSFNTKIGPPPGQTFCNGLPHEIKVEKDGYKVKLTVDELPPVSVAGPTKSTSVDTGDISYFGGVPDSLTTFGIRSKKSMNGCISKFTMDGKDYTSRIVPVGLASYGCENINP